jgi:predicted secreted protein
LSCRLVKLTVGPRYYFVARQSQALLELRATHANINAAIEELSRCVFVFHQCEQANRQIKDGQFYKALKARVPPLEAPTHCRVR